MMRRRMTRGALTAEHGLAGMSRSATAALSAPFPCSAEGTRPCSRQVGSSLPGRDLCHRSYGSAIARLPVATASLRDEAAHQPGVPGMVIDLCFIRRERRLPFTLGHPGEVLS